MNTPLSWRELLAYPSPQAHIVQLYQDEEFLCDAVSTFASSGLARGEAVVLVATPGHARALAPKLKAKGFNMDVLQMTRQLTVVNAVEVLPRLMVDCMPDVSEFNQFARGLLQRINARYAKVRWWREMVGLLWEYGNLPAALRLEQLADELTKRHSMIRFCSFHMDNFDSQTYGAAFQRLCMIHSHVIPVNDYTRFQNAFEKAARELLGHDHRTFDKMPSCQGGIPEMPAAAASLLWLRENSPQTADNILNLTREFYGAPLTLHS